MSHLRIANRNEFDKIYSIMEASFPPDERRTYEEQKALLNHPLYRIYVWTDVDKEISAFITVWCFEAFTFVEHFAVNPKDRNLGIGAAMLGEIKTVLSGLICLEVELPDTEIARRRIGFYERNGFKMNDYPYMQPAYSTSKNPVPLRIMTSEKCILEDEFQEMKERLYLEVYHVSEV